MKLVKLIGWTVAIDGLLFALGFRLSREYGEEDNLSFHRPVTVLGTACLIIGCPVGLMALHFIDNPEDVQR